MQLCTNCKDRLGCPRYVQLRIAGSTRKGRKKSLFAKTKPSIFESKPMLAYC